MLLKYKRMRISFKTVKQFVVLSILMKSVVACSSDDLFQGEGTPTAITKGNLDTPGVSEIYTDSTKNGAIVLSSAPVGNPYNVDTLKKAYALLYPTGRGRSATPAFTPTHYQVRFLPADSLEFRMLMTSGLVLTTIPLDKNVTEEGTYYFDPKLEAQHAPYTWQYTIVPATEPLPNMRHEITAEICAPNDGSRGRSVDGLSDVWPALEAKAYEMCGVEAPSKVNARGLSGMPGDVGKFIYVWDDKANQYIPAKGAFVVAFGHSWSSSGTTDERGSYASMNFPGPITRMAIQWQDASNNWVVYDGVSKNDMSRQAIYACSSLNQKWTYRIKGGKQQTFAVATRALHRLYKEYNYSILAGLVMPQKQFLKVVCIDSYYDEFAGLYAPNTNMINIAGKTSSGFSRSTYLLFGTTAHEIAHMIHYLCLLSDKKNWNKTDDIIIESWARFLQWSATEYEYNELSPILGRSDLLTFGYRLTLPDASGQPGMPGGTRSNTYNGTSELNYQDWPFFKHPIEGVSTTFLAYSPLMIDLVDDSNQYAYYRDYCAFYKHNHVNTDYKKYPNDQVRGYNLYEIQTAMKTAVNLNQLKENLKNIRPNSAVDKVKIDTLFNRYVYYWNKYK